MTWGTISGGPVNLCTWNMLYPYNYATNYGGQYQLNVMDMGRFTPGQAFDIQNVFNPFYQLIRFQGSLAAASNPAQNVANMAYAQAGYNSGFQIMDDFATNSSAERVARSISSLISQLDQALASDQLTAEQKNELRALKRKVEALQDKLADIEVLRQNGATNEQIKTAISQIRTQYRVLRDEVAAAADRISAELAAAAEAEAAAAEAEETGAGEEGTGAGEEAGDADDNDNAEEDSEVIPGISNVSQTFNPDMYAADVKDEKVIEIVNNIYQKVDGMGSSDIKTYMDENITKDNVVEVMLYWNKQYAAMYEEADPLGLTETLMDERAFHGYKICTKLLTSLEAKLKDYKGVDTALYNTASTQLSIARREHDAWWVGEDKMSTALNKAHAAIADLMAIKAQKDKEAEKKAA